jgi:hypothetical protein
VSLGSNRTSFLFELVRNEVPKPQPTLFSQVRLSLRMVDQKMPWCFDGMKPAGMLFFPPLSDERGETKVVPNVTEPENQMVCR